MATTEAQKRASRKYQSQTVAIQIRVDSKKRDEYKRRAESQGMSLSQWIISKLEEP